MRSRSGARCGDGSCTWGRGCASWCDWETRWSLVNSPLNCLRHGISDWPWYIVRHVCEFPMSETEIVMCHINWQLSCIKLNHNLLVKSWTHDLKSGFIITNHERMIWNQDLLYQIMNAWLEIRIYYIKSWMHDLKSGFIISNHKLMIWNQD